MEINLEVKRDELFLVWLDYLNPILKLTNLERRILAMFLYLVCLNSTASRDKVSSKVFSPTVRKAIRTKLGIGEPSFNNHFSRLRKKGLIVERDYGLDVAERLKLKMDGGRLVINIKTK